ncbi:hypothetical protein [Paraburkholderia sp. 32]|uniref:hypothetical protein n=1 Tax=Paraburkholderia sp. 32 TaxID=2991057 RepID=UPI003D22EB8B
MQKTSEASLPYLLADQRARQQEVSKSILRVHGSYVQYLRSLELIDIVRANDPLLARFFDLYERIFTLEEEREPIEGFQTVLDFNEDALVQKEFGPLSERITIAVEPDSRSVVGATNYVFYGYPGPADDRENFGASCQLNFICVDEGHRGLGIAGGLLEDLEKKLTRFAGSLNRPGRVKAFTTCEQNNPLRMTAEQLAEDMRSALIDPEERLGWWYRRGFRKLQFEYTQPPLSPEVPPCEYLDYYIRFVLQDREPDPASLPSRLLLEHLRRFFFVSVGKFAIDMSDNSEWKSLQAAISQTADVPISD